MKNNIYLEISDKEREYLMRVMDHFVATNPGLHEEVVSDIMAIYWRVAYLYESKHKMRPNDS